ncbi:MAG: flagellar biosynthesis anti-sigma factor FlgM [Actinomycetota bacterium]
MKISNEQVRKALESYVRQVEGKKSNRVEKEKSSESKVGESKRGDSVTFTARSEEFKRARELYDKLPDIRKDLVSELKNKIKSGSYEVTSKEIADKIIYRTFVDKWL